MNLPVLTVFALLSLGGTLVAYFLLTAVNRERAWLSIRPGDLGQRDVAGLILASGLGLYLELLLIRWISAEIRVFAYFKNFVLIACFLGFGLGCYLCRRAVSVIVLLVPLVCLVAVIQVPWQTFRRVIAGLPVLLGATSEMHMWGVNAQPLTFGASLGLLLASIVMLPLFALIAIAFIPIGQVVGWYLENAKNGITAYSVNVAASLGGIMLYTALCFAEQPPIVWFAVAAVLVVALVWRVRTSRWIAFGALLMCLALLAIDNGAPARTYWSPYQKLALTPIRVPGADELEGYQLETNSSWYQSVLNLSPQFVARHPGIYGPMPLALNAYNIPYRFQPNPSSVLILGSGMGNDVAGALRNGAGAVTAVEIDPTILKLGRAFHPEAPYASPRVREIVDDARSYVQNSRDRFDLIVFSLLDSHTTASHFSNIRIDNYVYTAEALRAAKALLAPGGVFIVKFQVERPWIATRLHDLLVTTFGSEPLHLRSLEGSTTRFFVAAPPARIAEALRDRAILYSEIAAAQLPGQSADPTTDDWPYFYQRFRGVPASVLTISAMLLIVSLLAAGRFGIGPASLRWEFFFLGAAFLLLEAQIVSRMALLFGTTWVVNSIVIAVLLLLIVAANSVVARFPRFPVSFAYAGILVSIALDYLLPVSALFFRSFALRAIVATLVLTLPAFFAGIVFIRRFSEARFAAEAIGSNLLGSLAGGLAESLSLWLGLSSLLVIAGALYTAAWVISRRGRASIAPAAPSSLPAAPV